MTVWGIRYKKWHLGTNGKNNGVSLRQFGVIGESVLDMCLDCDVGTMKWALVGNTQAPVAVASNMPVHTQHGWVPHFNMLYIGTTVQVMKIDPRLFGQKMDKIELR